MYISFSALVRYDALDVHYRRADVCSTTLGRESISDVVIEHSACVVESGTVVRLDRRDTGLACQTYPRIRIRGNGGHVTRHIAGRFPNGDRHSSIVTPTRPSRACCGDHCVVGGIRAAGLGFVVETPHQSRQDVGLPIGYHSRGQDLQRHRVVAYDRQYRREALARNYLNWSVVNSRLNSEALTGRAKVIHFGRTPLNLAAWEAALRRHPDKDFATYLCSGLRVGFRIGFVRGRGSKVPQPTCSPRSNTPISFSGTFQAGQDAGTTGPHMSLHCPH